MSGEVVQKQSDEFGMAERVVIFGKPFLLTAYDVHDEHSHAYAGKQPGGIRTFVAVVALLVARPAGDHFLPDRLQVSFL